MAFKLDSPSCGSRHHVPQPRSSYTPSGAVRCPVHGTIHREGAECPRCAKEMDSTFESEVTVSRFQPLPADVVAAARAERSKSAHIPLCAARKKDAGYSKPKEPRVKVCPVCGRQFDASGRGCRKYCSEACAYEMQKRQWRKSNAKAPRKPRPPKPPATMDKVCAVCGSHFTATGRNVSRRKYCSAECAETANRQMSNARSAKRVRVHAPIVAKTCVVCGAGFSTNLPNKLTCSAECAHERAKERERGYARKRNGEPTVYTKTCVICGAEFTCSGTGAYRRVTCSKECGAQHQRNLNNRNNRRRRRVKDDA